VSSRSTSANPKDDRAEKHKTSSLTDDDNRTRILEAALRLLADEGHAGLTIRRVASEAGCSTIGVYTWFGGKDGLIDAIWIEGFASFAQALKRAKPVDGPMGTLRAQAFAYRAWALKHPRHYRVMFMNAVVDHVPSTEAQIVSLSAFTELQRAVSEASGKNELRSDDLDAIAMACWGTVHGLVAIELANAAPPTLTMTRSKGTGNSRLADRAFSFAMDSLVLGFAR
jgi:AcrR family transcriptional regulator